MENALVRRVFTDHDVARGFARAVCGLGFALCLAACTEAGPVAATAPNVAVPVARASASGSGSASGAGALVTLGERSLSVSEENGRCIATVTSSNAAHSYGSRVVPLDLLGPCQLLVWQADSFKGPKAASGGIRIGADGEAMAGTTRVQKT